MKNSYKFDMVLIICLLLSILLVPAYIYAENQDNNIKALIEKLNKGDIFAKEEAVAELVKLKDPEVIQGLVASLRSDDILTKKYAALALGIIKDPRSIEALRQALGDRNELVASQAKSSLMAFGKEAEKSLLKALNDKNPRVRWKAAELLAYLKNEASIKYLWEAVEKGSPHEKLDSLKNLSLLGDKKAVEPLIASFIDIEKEVSKKAPKILGAWLKRDPSIAPQLLKGLKESSNPIQKSLLIDILGIIKEPEVINTIVALTNDENAIIRSSALGYIASLKDKQFLQLLINGTKDKDSTVVKSAITGLGELGIVESIDPLIEVLKSDNLEIASLAVSALGKIGKLALPNIVPLLKDNNRNVRYFSAQLIGIIGDSSVFESLLPLINDEDSDVKDAAIRALGNIHDERGVPYLIELLKETDSKINEAVLYSLVEIGEKSIPSIIETFKKHDDKIKEDDLSQILIRIGSSSIPYLKELYETDDTRNSIFVIKTIGMIGEPEGFEILKSALNNQNPNLRAESAYMLSKFPEEGGNLLLKALNDPIEDVRKAVLTSLGEIGDPQFLPYLSGILTKDTINVKKSAISAIGKLGTEEAIRTIIPYISDKDYSIRKEVVGALGNTLEPIDDQTLSNNLDYIVEFLSDENLDIRESAKNTLIKINTPQVLEKISPLLSSNDPSIRKVAIEILGEIGKEKAIHDLIALLKEDINYDILISLSYILQREEGNFKLTEEEIETLCKLIQSDEETVRIKASYILGLLGKDATLPLMRIAQTGNKTSRLIAFEALGKIADKRALNLLLDILQNDPDIEIQRATLIPIGLMKDSKGLTPLIKKLKSNDWKTRASAATALGKLGDPKAVAGLMLLKNDDILKVRKAAGEALEKITGQSCPLIVSLTPFKNADLMLFVFMVSSLAVIPLRKRISVLDKILYNIAKLFKYLLNNEKFKWTISFIFGSFAIAVFAYCVYCEITEPTLEAPNKDFLQNLYLFTLKVLPFFIGGSFIFGFIMKYFTKKWRFPNSMISACIISALLPICSCGAIPLARAMMSLDIPKRTVIAFLVVTPVLNPFVIFLSYGVIGTEYTLLRIFGTFLIAVTMGIIIEHLVGNEEIDDKSPMCSFCKSCVSSNTPSSDSALIMGWQLMGMLYKYIVIGTLLGAVIATYMPVAIVTKYLGSNILGLVMAVTIGIPLYLCSGEEVIFLKPLIDLGLPMGHAIAFTIAANGICITSISVLFGAIGRKTTIMLTLLFFIEPFILGYFINMAMKVI